MSRDLCQLVDGFGSGCGLAELSGEIADSCI